MTNSPDLLQAAQYYADRDWPVLPLKPGEKVPLTTHGLKDASTNESRIVRWWDQHEHANIGVATGKIARIWVLDVDGEDGNRSLTALENEIGPLPDTLEQKTGGGGRQLFFLWPEAREVRNKQSVRAGIDVRGEGGYVVVPPSMHPSGQRYEWPHGDSTTIAAAPLAWLDLIAPKPRRAMPWDRTSPVTAAPAPVPASIVQAPVIKRAKLYLAECEPAAQGSGGHNALLWAARALVVGFQLDDQVAIDLLWSDYNPRCSPPWDRGKGDDLKDFERKVGEARRTPANKPVGWLLDEYGLRDDADAMAQIARGQQSQRNLLASVKVTEPVPEDDGEATKQKPFPVSSFPLPIANFCRQLTDAQCVDASYVGLPILVAAGAAIGNMARLYLKKGFIVPPTLWGAVVGKSGTNKSAPLAAIMAPLRDVIPSDGLTNDLLNPQGRLCVGDATLEALIGLLAENPRGILQFRDELAGWAKSFNAYRKGGAGGDEQAWIEFWNASSYQLDRKTNNEQLYIPVASCSILGGIPPAIFADCCDPAKFASGLIPRMLIVCPPMRDSYWSEDEVADDATGAWRDAIHWLRSRPFHSLDVNTGQYKPHVLVLDDAAKVAYVAFFNQISHELAGQADDNARAIISKTRMLAGRLTLVHHGLQMACEKLADFGARKVGLASVTSGCIFARWFLDEQMRVFEFSTYNYNKKTAAELLATLKLRHSDNAEISVRDVYRMNQRKFPSKKDAMTALESLVGFELARWFDLSKKKIVLL